VIFFDSAPSGFAVAWQHSAQFWAQTLAAVARHPLEILFCSAGLAAERAYLLLRSKPIRPWQFVLWEALLTVWRLLLCLVAVWAALTPHERQGLMRNLNNEAQLQYTLQRLGGFLGRELRVLAWELVLFFAAFFLLNMLLRLVMRLLAQVIVPLGEIETRRAYVAIVRNLLLVPLALIYLVEMLRQAFA
jgi:hypothetical protein